MIGSLASVLSSSTSPLSDALSIRLGSLAHLGGILLFPPALLIRLSTRGRARFAAIESKEALNWQITVGLVWLVVAVATRMIGLALFFTPLDGLGAALGSGAPWLLYAVNVAFSVVGYRASRNGAGYRYPLALRFLK